MQAHVPSFDIFSGRFPDRNVEWLESVEGLASAVRRMKEIAAGHCGHYFVFDTVSTALATVDTTYSSRTFTPSKREGAA